MLDNDYFAHVNLQGESPTDRAAAQGYPSPIGENLAWNGSTGPIDQTQALMAAHNGLFDSPSHRSNMLYATYAEGGMGAIAATLVEAVQRSGGRVHFRQEATRIAVEGGLPVRSPGERQRRRGGRLCHCGFTGRKPTARVGRRTAGR